MISVIISTYKRPERLKRAIESVLNQTFKDFEVIIVDDNSKDNTEEVVKSFKDARIKYIKRTKNFGCDTRPKNEGILASKGEYIAFLDDDNTYRPDHLAILFNEMQKNSKTDVAYGDRWLNDETKRIAPQLGIASDFDPSLLMQRNFIDTSDVLIKRQALFDVGGWDERYKKYVDWNLWVRLCKYGKKFVRIPLIITDYYLHEDMKSVKVKTKHDSETRFAPDWDSYDLEIELPYLKNTPRDNPRVGIFSITYNRLDYTKKSFKSLKETAEYPYEHFVIDNGSTDGSIDWVKEHTPNFILNPYNYGISKASNQITNFMKGKFDIIVKWDNDAIGLTKGWLAKMVEIWKSNHKIALSCYIQGLVDNPGGAPRIGYGTLRGELVGVTKHLGGICHFVDASVYDQFKWDDNSFLHGVQDMEMSQYLMYHGFTQGYLENYFVSHGPDGTNKQRSDYPEYFEKRIKQKQTRYKEGYEES